ncbi:Uncharacterised protein [uncultured Bacteroides sp.]|nr:Uncharacterised protein [uncultured Bacteroides sp.]
MKKNPDFNSIYPLFIHEIGGFHFLPPRTELPPPRLTDAKPQQVVIHPRNGPSLPSPTARGASSSSIGGCADAAGCHSSTKRAVSTFFHRARSLPPHRLADVQTHQVVIHPRNGPSLPSPTARGAYPSSTCGCAAASGSPYRTTVPESRAIPP